MLDQIKPTKPQRVIDLVRQAGIDVSDWARFAGGDARAASNPKYCYEWSFVEPGRVVVLNLWHADLRERNGIVSTTFNLRNGERGKGVWRAREEKLDRAILNAWTNRLPVRAVINDGEMGVGDGADAKASRVRYRLLDPAPWAVTAYNEKTGQSVITRGRLPDQSVLPDIGPASVLIQSSPTTQAWIQNLRSRLPHLEYRETRYWASFRALTPKRVVAYLNPSKQGIRVFLALDAGDGPDLLPTPSSSGWAARFPTIFGIAGAQALEVAITLILKSEARTAARAVNTLHRPDHSIAEELLPGTEYAEGTARRVLVNAYERNGKARQKCIGHFGRVCSVCGFSFETKYGPLLNGYIHVHHLVPIAQIGKEYSLDPLRDLRPVCPNCHAVIHRRDPPFSIEEVKQMIKEP